MPCPTARPRGGVVGRAKGDFVPSDLPSRRKGCVGDVSPARSLGGFVGERNWWLVVWGSESGTWTELVPCDVTSPDGDERVAASSGSAVRRSDRKTAIWFGLLGSDPGMGEGGKDDAPSWRFENVGGMEGSRRKAGDAGFAAGGGTAKELQAGWQCGKAHGCRLRFGLGSSGAWVYALGPCYFIVMSYCYLLIVSYGFMPEIITYYSLVGQCGQCPGMHTQCALSGLARRRAICLIKWTQPPSGRMKLCVAGFISVRQHSGKAVLFATMLLRNRVIFPVCHRYVKTNGVAIRALFANWCLLEYIDFVENPGFILGCSLYASCNLGFRLYVPPLYSAISLIKA